MRRLAWLLLLLLLLPACSGIKEIEPGAAGDLFGQWSGEGHFMRRNLLREYGSMRLEFEIHPDLTVSGGIDAAELVDGKLRGWRDGYEIRARLTGEVREGWGKGKDCLIVMITEASPESLVIEFHLKSNFTLDLGMFHC